MEVPTVENQEITLDEYLEDCDVSALEEESMDEIFVTANGQSN